VRYWMQGVVHTFSGAGFPYGTLAVNILGSFLIGFLMSVFDERFVVQPMLRIFLTVGVLGGFTTFSSFSYETMALLRDGSYTLGLLNVAGSVGLCLVAAWVGITVGKLL
jgi:fluoride exporter